MIDIYAYLSGNAYPGRGIMLGRSEDGLRSVAVYFIMGRSENSRNRVFTETSDGIKTEAYDPSELMDPGLVIYHPVREYRGRLIVTNGAQTDAVRDALKSGRGFRRGLKAWSFEPDPPIYTPRISGLIGRRGDYRLSILKSADGDPRLCCRHYYEYETPLPGLGHLIHTYLSDGNPPPTFHGEPVAVSVDAGDGLEPYARGIWDALNRDNRVALYARETALATGEFRQIIINRHGGSQ